MWPLVSADKLDVLESVHYAMDHAFPDSGAPSMEAVQSMLKFIQDYLNSIKLRTNRGSDVSQKKSWAAAKGSVENRARFCPNGEDAERSGTGS